MVHTQPQWLETFFSLQLSGKLNPIKVFEDIGHHVHYLKLTIFEAFNVGIVANHGQIVRSSPTLEKVAMQTLDHGLRRCYELQE